MNEEVKPPFNPLKWLWNLFGTIGGVISLSSMVQTWFDALLKWKGFIASIIESYRSIVEPAMDFLFGWLPFVVPYWMGDYLIVGTIISLSWRRASSGFTRRANLREFVLFLTAWPATVAYLFLRAFLLKRLLWAIQHQPDPISYRIFNVFGPGSKSELVLQRHFWYWLGAIILGLAVLLAINTQL